MVRRLVDELVDGGVGDQPAPADDDQPCCGERHFAHQMGGHEHRVTIRGQILEHLSHPAHTFGVEAVDRLVQHDGLRVAK